MKKVLIFGYLGFVGQYLEREFANHGYTVYGSDVLEATDIQRQVDSSRYFAGDLLDATRVKAIIDTVRPDMIVNLAAISSVGQSWGMPQTTVEVNVVGALNIMEAARVCDPMPKVMFIGSSEEYQICDAPMDEETRLNANNPYGISKMMQEEFANLYRERYGMQVYCVRPFNHTGVGQRESFVLPSFCKQVARVQRSGESGIIRVGNLSARRDFSDVRDIVCGYRMIMEGDNCKTIYNLGSGEAHSIQEMLDYLISLCTYEIKVEIDPERFRPIDTPCICCDNSKAQRELGWRPEYSIYDTIKEMFETYVGQED